MAGTMKAGGIPSTFVGESSVLLTPHSDLGLAGKFPEVRHAERVVRRMLRRAGEEKSAAECRVHAAANVIRLMHEHSGGSSQPSCLVATAAMASRIASQLLSRIRRHRRRLTQV